MQKGSVASLKQNSQQTPLAYLFLAGKNRPRDVHAARAGLREAARDAGAVADGEPSPMAKTFWNFVSSSFDSTTREL